MPPTRYLGVAVLALGCSAAIQAGDPSLERPPRTLTPGKVWYATFSPDGRKIAAACGQYGHPGQVIVWDIPSGKPLWRRAYKNGARSVAFSPNGKILAVALYDGPAELVDPATGEVRLKLHGQKGGLNGFSFFADGKRMVSAGLDNVIRIWDVHTGKELQALRGHAHMVMSVAVSPDGRRLVSCGGDPKQGGKPGQAKLWDLTTGKERAALSGHTSVIESAAYSPDGKTVATGSWDWTVRLWSAETGKPLRLFHTQGGGGMSVQFSPDGKTVAGVSCNLPNGAGTVWLWDVATGNVRKSIRQSRPVASVGFSPDGKTLVTACWDSSVRLWEVATGQQRQGFGNLTSTWTSRPSPKQSASISLAAQCAKLSSGDASEAYRAMWTLADGADAAVNALQSCLQGYADQPTRVAPAQVALLLENLDDDQVQKRETAFEALESLGSTIKPKLEQRLKNARSAEVILRVQLLLDRLTNKTALSPHTLLQLRAIEALEHIGNTKARAALKDLAATSDNKRIQREAQVALDRLNHPARLAR